MGKLKLQNVDRENVISEMANGCEIYAIDYVNTDVIYCNEEYGENLSCLLTDKYIKFYKFMEE